MVGKEQENRVESPKQYPYGIDVSCYITAYGIEEPKMKDVLERFPTLCYLLGHVEPAIDSLTGEQVRDNRPDKIERQIWFLKEGSGMFGLKEPEDAIRWKGIFNHTLGSARFVEAVATILKNLPEEQKEAFVRREYDFTSFEKIDPQILRDFMVTTHAARRIVDESVWHECHDTAHPWGAYGMLNQKGDVRDSGDLTEKILQKNGAPHEFIDLIRVEQHADELIKLQRDGKFADIRFAIMTYCDWIFSQSPMTLDERFAGLRKSGREEEIVLDQLEKAGKQFEKDFAEITGKTWNDIVSSPLSQWEYDIREAYCASGRLSVENVFPAFWEAWQKQGKNDDV